MLAERLGECLLEAHLRRLVIQNERQALVEEAVKYPLLCRFSDAGNDEARHTLGGRRLKSAEARNRGRWGTVGAAGSMGNRPGRPVGRG